jgi:hypothetical protein
MGLAARSFLPTARNTAAPVWSALIADMEFPIARQPCPEHQPGRASGFQGSTFYSYALGNFYLLRFYLKVEAA